MTINENPPIPSASNRQNPCFGTDSTIAALNVLADDQHSYLLPYAQFLRSRRTANPALEHEPQAPPERLLIHFAMADVLVLGSGLKALERGLQKFELKFVKATGRREAAAFHSHVAAVSIAWTKEVV